MTSVVGGRRLDDRATEAPQVMYKLCDFVLKNACIYDIMTTFSRRLCTRPAWITQGTSSNPIKIYNYEVIWTEGFKHWTIQFLAF